MSAQTQPASEENRPAPAALPMVWLGRIAKGLGENISIVIAFTVFFLFWEVMVRMLSVPVFILPPPSIIAERLAQDWAVMLIHAYATLVEIVLGFGLSIVVGLGLAIAVVSNRVVEKLVMPFVISLKTIPKIALAPILIIWFGYGLMPKVAIAFLISFFPILISAIIGLRSAEKEMIYLARSMGASTLQIFVKIRFPKALPGIFGGLRVGIVQAGIGAIVAEYLASERGLGYLQIVAQSRMDTTLLFSSVVVLSLMGILLFNLVVLFEKILMPWAKNTTDIAA